MSPLNSKWESADDSDSALRTDRKLLRNDRGRGLPEEKRLMAPPCFVLVAGPGPSLFRWNNAFQPGDFFDLVNERFLEGKRDKKEDVKHCVNFLFQQEKMLHCHYFPFLPPSFKFFFNNFLKYSED